jgi:hypothetical protein
VVFADEDDAVTGLEEAAFDEDLCAQTLGQRL